MCLPPLSRDALLRAYGVDCLIEEGKIIIIGTSIHDWPDSTTVTHGSDVAPATEKIHNTSNSAAALNDGGEKRNSAASDAKNFPWRKPKGWFQDRMIIKDFKRYDFKKIRDFKAAMIEMNLKVYPLYDITAVFCI